jgi:hypothetical protein
MPDSPAEKSLRRVLLISAIDGWSITVFAGLCTLLSLPFGEWVGVCIGAIVTTGGIVELRGRTRLINGDATGLSWLVRAQVLILATIWLYAFRTLLAFDQAAIMAEITPEMRDYLAMSGVALADVEALLKPVYFGFYLVVMGVTLLFQGGLALYYFSCRTNVSTALATSRADVPPSLPQA